MTDIITATVIETKEVVTAIVTEGDNVTVTDNGVEHNVHAGGNYECEFGPGTPATVVDNGVEHEVEPGGRYSCQYGPAADGECHNTDESISVAVPAGGSNVFPDGVLIEFDESETPLIAGKTVTAKVPINSIITDTNNNELLNLPPGIPGQIADSVGTNPDGSTFNVRATQPFNVPLNLELEFIFQADYDLSITGTALLAKYAATWNSNDITDNIATIQWKKNGTNVSLPFATLVGDKLSAEITKINPALDASVILKTAFNG